MERLAWLLAMLIAGIGGEAEVGLRIGPESAEKWSAQITWQSNPSEKCSVSVRNGALDFSVPDPNRGMKWTYRFRPVDSFTYRWLVIRYRMERYAPGPIDYLVWCNTATGGDGLRLLPPNAPQWDEQRHVVAWDLRAREAGDEISMIAVQCRAGAEGGAHLLVEAIELTDVPPRDAEGDVAPVTEPKTAEPQILQPKAWTPHKDWLANPTGEFAVTATKTGLRFEVKQAGQGMKWSTELPEGIEDMLYLTVRYRAANIDPRTWDYFVYLAARGGGAAEEEQYCVSLGDLCADGEWHAVTAPVTVSTVKTLAVQVQAQGGPGYAEIAWMRFSNVKPKPSLGDLVAFEAADGLRARERELTIVGLLAPASEAQAALEASSWFEAPCVAVRDVRFALIEGGRQVAATSFADPGEIHIGGIDRATEIFLLLGARFARAEEPSYGGGRLREVSYPHRFVAAVTYEDGTVDEFIPGPVPKAGPVVRFAVSSGIGAYVIGPLAAKPIREIVLRDGMRNGQFFLVAATANTGRPRFCTDRPEERPYVVASPPFPSDGPPGWHWKVDVLRFNPSDRARPFIWQLRFPNLPALVAKGPLFRLVKDGRELPAGEVEYTRTRRLGSDSQGIETRGRNSEADLEFTLTVEPEGADEDFGFGANCRLEVRNQGNRTVRLQPTFPDFPALKAPEAWGESWYFFPRRGCVINHIPIGLREAYSGTFPFQVESVFWPDLGLGMYIMTRDLNLTHRFWRLSKDADGIHMSIEYPEITLQPGEKWTSVDTVIGVNEGDWHGAWEAYRDWLNTWYRPAAPRKKWFRQVFNFRQQFLHFEVPAKSGLFDPATKQFHMDDVIEQDIESFGGVDYLHIFDWGWSEQYGRCGDYDHWEQLGGAENFAQAVAEVQQRGIPVGLYIEGYLVDPQSNYGKAHGEEFQLINAEGKPYPYFAPSYNMCSAVKEWQDYLASVYRRTRKTIGAIGYYVDEMGFADPGHICYAEHHGHPVPYPPAPGQCELMRKIREALGPDVALYTEESPPDVTSQFQDGSFTYNHASVSDDLSPTHINLYRFTIPSFKTFEIIVCDKPLGSNVQAVKRVFFSGEGIWLEGLADEWFTPETRAIIAKTHAILSRYADAFTTDRPQPLVPTLMGNVYANEFPVYGGPEAGAETTDPARAWASAMAGAKCVWTLYNANPRTVRGPVLRVEHYEGTRYWDAWNDRPAEVRIVGDEAEISLKLGPKDVGCVVRVPEE